jgi:hypothetical protein
VILNTNNIKKLNIGIFLIVMYIWMPWKVFAQNGETIVSTINIHVKVLSKINVKEAKNIQLVVRADSSSKIEIDPKLDPGAGRFEADGTGFAPIKISFPVVLELKEVNGDHLIHFHTIVSSYAEQDQGKSRLLDKNSASLKFNASGQRFFWIGGRANIHDAPSGKYVGTMSFNMEYD